MDMARNECYDRVIWSPEDGEHVGLCTEFPSLSWLAPTPEGALAGIARLTDEITEEMQSSEATIA
jgi:hypothetical protein